MPVFGFSMRTWRAAKEEAKAALRERASSEGTMAYSELVEHVNAVRFGPRDGRLDTLLAEISTEEDEAGRGMMSALVVHKSGDQLPGPGFFQLAGDLGKDTSDEVECWIAEVKAVHAVWSVRRRA